MHRAITIIHCLVFAALLTACQTDDSMPDQPGWITDPGGGAVGSAVTHVKGRYFQEDLAIARARERLATDEDFLLLDVRTKPEFESRPPIDDPRFRHIEMTEYRKEIPNLPSEKPIIIICQAGQRSYEVQCALRASGFNKTRSVEGGMSVFLRTGR